MDILKSILAALSLSLLVSCGGGGGGSDTPSAAPAAASIPAGSTTSTGTTPPSSATTSGSTNDGDGGSAGTTSPPPPTSTNPSTSDSTSTTVFAATATQAPADGATISGTVRILIEGSGIENVELLPSTGYAPLIARGIVTGDRIGAYIDFDTTVMPDGPITLRVAAFNLPFGQGGSEVTAMPARTWTITNSTAPSFSAQLITAPPNNYFWLGLPPGGGAISPSERFEVSGSGLGNVELVSAKDESILYGRFTISPDKTGATLDWDYRTYGGWAYDLYEVRILAWDVPPGEAGRMIEVMEPRSYWQKLSLGCQGQGTCGGTAP